MKTVKLVLVGLLDLVSAESARVRDRIGGK